MNREDIDRMAREAHRQLVTEDYPGHTARLDPWTMRLLERFAALVAAAEREACARILIGEISRHEQLENDCAMRGRYDEVDALRSTAWRLSECVAAIRARRNT